MATRKILQFGIDDMLRKHSRTVEKFDRRLWTLLDDMADTMYEADGAGLAAVQVGVLKRCVVIDVGDGLVEMINPEILETKGAVVDYEGCLSIPGKSARVERPEYVKARAYNREGQEYEIEGWDLMARAICHETVHLQGILYIDKALPKEEGEVEA